MKKNSYLPLIPFGVLMFVVALGIDRIFVHRLENQLVGGLLQLFFIAAAFTVGAKLVPRFGAFTIISSVATILSALLGLPNAFKIAIGILLGLMIDIWVLLFRFKDWARCSGIMIGFTACGAFFSSVMSLYSLRSIFDLHEALDYFIALEDKVIVVCSVGGLIGALIGIAVFEKGVRKIRFIKGIIHDRSKNAPIQA